MNHANYFFVLGAPDPESREIEELLKFLGIPYGYAIKADKRVRSYDAYEADEIHEMIKPYSYDPSFLSIVLVECGGNNLLKLINRYKHIIVDHHAEGHPGYGKPPEQFWEGSSIGQVYTLLGASYSKRQLMIAAADHCLGAAYAGRCANIDPEELLNLRVEIKSDYKSLPYTEVMSQIFNAVNSIERANTINILDEPVADFTYFPAPSEVGEAASILGTTVAYGEYVKGLGVYKYGIVSAKPEVIRHWMENHALRLNLTNIYGDAERGYAGGYRETRIGT